MTETTEEKTPLFSKGYRNYVLLILLTVYIFNFLDRQILAILMQSIKEDLLLTDTQLGFLSGIAFAIFYVTLGIPIARLADRSNRVTIIAVALTVWSLMTALCGMAQNFIQLLIARIGVGVGEAGCSPPAHSLISDYFPVDERASAMARYALGIPIGTLFGFLLGGWINEFFGWRVAFMVVGIPGVLFAIVVKMTLREPPRGYADGIKVSTDGPPPLGETFKILWSRRAFRHLSFGGALTAFAGYGLTAWIPAFLERSHNMETGEIGTWLALLSGIAGGIGTLIGGYLTDYLAKYDRRWYVWVPAIGLAIGTPFYVAAFLAPEKFGMLLYLIVPYIMATLYLGPTFALTQGLVKLRMRALASAILLFILNIIGLGLGPFLVGVLSDFLAADFGIESLRYALLIASLAKLWSSFHYFMASRSLREDLEQAEQAA